MFLYFHFLGSNVSENKCYKHKWHMLFFTHIKLVMPVLACAHAIATHEMEKTVLDNPYFKENYKIIAIDLSKQQALNADPREVQQINFTGNLDRTGNTTFFIIK